MTFLPRVVRFGIIGAASTGAYVALALIGKGLGLPVSAASLAAYAVAFPFSYFGHRRVTFQSDRPHREAVSRFVALNLFGLLLAVAMPWLLCDQLGLPGIAGIVAVAVTVPLSSFLGQSLLVFPSAGDAPQFARPTGGR